MPTFDSSVAFVLYLIMLLVRGDSSCDIFFRAVWASVEHCCIKVIQR